MKYIFETTYLFINIILKILNIIIILKRKLK